MNRLVLIAALLSLACEDTPPAGTRNLSSPVKPVFMTEGDQELLAFIDQGHDALRLLDLSAGTYQWGSNPYFPREIALDDSPVDLAYSEGTLVALSLSGQAFAVPATLGLPLSLGLDLAEAHPLALISSDRGLWRLDADCTLHSLGDGAVIEAGAAPCRALGHGSFQNGDGAVSRIVAGDLQTLVPGTRPLRAVRPSQDGGWWLLAADLRVLSRIDGEGQELRRIALPFDVLDLVETSAEEGPILSMVGLDAGVVYMREDGLALPPLGTRTLVRLTALEGSNNGLSVARDFDENLGGEDLLAVAGLPLGELPVSVTEVEGLLVLDGLPETEPQPYVELRLEDATCRGRLDAENRLNADPSCPTGEGITASLTSASWHLYAASSWAVDQVFDPAASLARIDDSAPVAYSGHTFTASAPAPMEGAILGARGKNGAGSTVFSDGWFSNVIAAEAKTNYADSKQTWLWLTSPSDNAIVQMPVLATESYSILVFR